MSEQLITRFNNIMSWAEPISAVYINTGAKQEPLHSVISRAHTTLEPLMQNAMTQFMAAPVLEYFFKQMLPAINIPANELLAGDTTKLNEVKQFLYDLEHHPVRTMWAERSETFRMIAESAGYTFVHNDYQDLALIAPIVADALTTFDNSRYRRNIFKVREGSRSGCAPVLMDEIHLFYNVADAVHIYENATAPAFIGFFGVEKTYAMNNDQFNDWRYGCNARKKNVMNRGMTEDEYNNTVDTHSRKIYCIVRDGENMWLFVPPITTSHGECLDDNGSFTNWYGQRSTYTPIQIFWKGFATQNESSSDLVPYKPRKWSMKEILTEEQKIWLPMFFSTVKGYFFTDEEPNAGKARMCAETNIILSLPDSQKYINLPAIQHSSIHIPTIEDLFSRDTVISADGSDPMFISQSDKDMYRHALKILKWMDITSKDIADAPIGFDELEFEKQAMNRIEERTVAAYYKIIRDRLPEFWATHAASAHKWFSEWLNQHHDQVIEDIREGRIQAEVHVHNRQLLDEKGQPKMVCKYSWSSEMVPHLDSTDIDIGKILNKSYAPYVMPYQWFSSVSLMDKRPPASVSIYCKTPEDVAHLMHVDVEDLPIAIQVMNAVDAFDRHNGRLNLTAHFIYNKSDFKKTFPNL